MKKARRGIYYAFLSAVIALIVGISMTSCAGTQKAYHEQVMRGTILDLTDGVAYLCIGSKDGAQTGQELDVYAFTKRFVSKSSPVWEKRHTGKIRIMEVVDEHYAKARVIDGKPGVGDIAEITLQ